MSMTPIQASDPLQQLAQLLLARFDTNKDGQFSLDEFSAILGRLTPGTVQAAVATSGTATTPVYPTATSVTRAHDRLEGFNSEKIANREHRTPKYIFARVAMETDLSPVRDKASAEATLRGMVPKLQEAGLDVLGVTGDKIKINYEGKDIWIDVIRGASGGAPAFQWLPV
jgi:hypothetical protein